MSENRYVAFGSDRERESEGQIIRERQIVFYTRRFSRIVNERDT